MFMTDIQANQMLIKQQMEDTEENDDYCPTQNGVKSSQVLVWNSNKDFSKSKLSTVKIKDTKKKLILRSFSRPRDD